MKDSLFEMLMNFFEKTLTQIKEASPESAASTGVSNTSTEVDTALAANKSQQVFQQPKHASMRVFTADEQFKFTKASYQFLVRLLRLKFIAPEAIEEVIHQLLFSDSPFVTLQETKWAIRNALSEQLNPTQLAFLDLVLYQKEDRLPLH